MQIKLGYELCYTLPKPTPMILMLNVHYSRVADLVYPDHLLTSPSVPVRGYRDVFGNWCSQLVAPAGTLRIFSESIINDTGIAEATSMGAAQWAVESLPAETLPFLLGSRYCETDRMTEIAWRLFEGTPAGWARVQAICDFVHKHITFGYEFASPTKTAWEVYNQPKGVCRDFAHLALTFCRCMNIPARYCTGYLGDIGVPASAAPMDFAGWFEVFLGGAWHTFDPRNNARRIGRVLIARGRDAADVAITTTFGPNTLSSFRVITDEI